MCLMLLACLFSVETCPRPVFGVYQQLVVEVLTSHALLALAIDVWEAKLSSVLPRSDAMYPGICCPERLYSR